MNNCKVEKFGCTYNDTGCSDCKVNQAYQQGKADAIEGFEHSLCKYLGIENAKKHGNENLEQMQNSYSTYMCYEIKDAIDDVAEQLKEYSNEH